MLAVNQLLNNMVTLEQILVLVISTVWGTTAADVGRGKGETGVGLTGM